MKDFSERVKEKRKKSSNDFHDCIVELSSIVAGKGVLKNLSDEYQLTLVNALDEILKSLGVKNETRQEAGEDDESYLKRVLRDTGTMFRRVRLKGKWYQDAAGVYLGWTQKGNAVALLPAPNGGYHYYDYMQEKTIKVHAGTKEDLREDAIYFYRALPLKSLHVKDLLLFVLKGITVKDAIMLTAVTLLVSLIGLLTPYVNKQIFSRVIPSEQISLLIPITTLLLGVLISTIIINISRTLVGNRVEQSMDLSVEAASMARLLTLPTDFFKQYNSGELTSRMKNISQLCEILYEMIFTAGLSTLFSVMYIFQITSFTKELVTPAIVVILLPLLLSMVFSVWSIRINRRKMQEQAKLSGLTFSLFSGIEKIRLTGSEKSAFSKWARAYHNVAALNYNPPLLLKLYPAIAGLISMGGTIVLYYFSIMAKISVADYMAFNVCYGMAAGSFSAFASLLMSGAQIRPVLEMASPILNAVPETQAGKKILERITGEIEFSDVSFRYPSEDEDKLPLVLEHFSLKIHSGDYIGIAGKTGCGKSTLIRLLIGFETAEKGALYFDGENIDTLDLPALRRQMGVVLQDGKLFSGSIYENISIFTPNLTMEEAWEAAQIAGLAEDIRNMPMKMQTMITEGTGGISGGQKQRLLIARAIASKAQVLILDEATSALDNVTQNRVSKALDELQCTRIVIAHRLATLKKCSRIIVMDQGRIVEDGEYEELIKQNGHFAELVRYQMLQSE